MDEVYSNYNGLILWCQDFNFFGPLRCLYWCGGDKAGYIFDVYVPDDEDEYYQGDNEATESKEESDNVALNFQSGRWPFRCPFWTAD